MSRETCFGVPDNTHLKWLNQVINSIDISTNTKHQFHTSIDPWGNADCPFYITLNMPYPTTHKKLGKFAVYLPRNIQ